MISVIPAQALAELYEIARTAPPGNFAEFGVYQGGSAWGLAEIAREQARRLFLFDTFTGIPFKGALDSHVVGDFGDTSESAVRAAIPEAVIVAGIFPESLTHTSIGSDMAPLAFVHVDCDQYASIAAACRIFPMYMVPGALMLFDDFGCLEGATQAVRHWGQPIELTRCGKALWRKP